MAIAALVVFGGQRRDPIGWVSEFLRGTGQPKSRSRPEFGEQNGL